MSAQQNARAASLAGKLSIRAIGITLAVLCLTLGLISLRMWSEALAQGDRILQDDAAAAAGVLEIYDETARNSMLRDFALFRDQFDGNFVLGARAGKGDDAARPVLSNRGVALNGNFEVVDRFTALTGAAATVFARDGDDFRRITTSLKKDDGTRAIGTSLDRKHPAYALMLEGKPYSGRARLFGKTYMTHYEPILQDGRTIGILFVGSDMGPLLDTLRRSLAAQHPFEQGAVFAVDLKPGATEGELFAVDNGARLDPKDPAAAALLASMREGAASGTLAVPDSLALPGGKGGALHLAYARSTTWNWAVVATAPTQRITAQVRGNLAALWLACLVAVGVLCASLFWMMRKLVGKPIGAMVEALTALARGDLSRPIAVTGRDEIGRLAVAMEDFRRRLATTLSGVQANAEEVASASAQIATASGELSTQAASQASALEQTAATMEQVSSAARSNADSAQRASELAATASAVASRGGALVDRVVATMQDINEGSRTIAEIIAVIDGIAFQTNILALNAAVEAARAGEQGRGFAVVAGEVRALAQRSADAARQIRGLITRSVEQAHAGGNLVNEAGQTMQDILGAIEQVRQIAAQIATASAEQSAGVRQVGEAVAQLDRSTRQNAALVEQSAGSSHGLKGQAAELAQAIAQFRLERQTPDPGRAPVHG